MMVIVVMTFAPVHCHCIFQELLRSPPLHVCCCRKFGSTSILSTLPREERLQNKCRGLGLGPHYMKYLSVNTESFLRLRLLCCRRLMYKLATCGCTVSCTMLRQSPAADSSSPAARGTSDMRRSREERSCRELEATETIVMPAAHNGLKAF